MSIDLSIRAKSGLEITYEFPTCSHLMKLRPVGDGGTNDEFELFLSLEQWWAIRQVFPKAESYTMIADPHGNESHQYLRDHPASDAYAETYYKAELAKRPKPEAQLPDEPPADISETLRSLPVVGTLNVDTNKFTPAPGYGLDGENIPSEQPAIGLGYEPKTPPQMLPVVEEDEAIF